MDDHTISWASVIYVALGSGALGYLLGAGSALLLVGLLGQWRREQEARDGESSIGH